MHGTMNIKIPQFNSTEKNLKIAIAHCDEPLHHRRNFGWWQCGVNAPAIIFLPKSSLVSEECVHLG